MPESETETQYKQLFMARVRQARERLGWKQWEMAEALGMPQDKYKQYEGRSLMPHHIISRFCTISHVDMTWLMTGRGKPTPAVQPEPAAEVPLKAPRKTRSRRAA